jgi:hypothetical protein
VTLRASTLHECANPSLLDPPVTPRSGAREGGVLRNGKIVGQLGDFNWTRYSLPEQACEAAFPHDDITIRRGSFLGSQGS